MKNKIDPSYEKIEGDFYYRQTVSKNPLRRWFHLSRYKIANSLVKSKYVIGDKIADLGCGSCDWNINTLRVFGVDLNEELLKTAKNKNRLYDYEVADAADTGLPEKSFDIVTSFEFLEHVDHYEKVVEESIRILKEGGYCIASVPFDVFLSLWRPLFIIQVILQGYILQNPYYKNRCGHINHFSADKLKKIFQKHGYVVDTFFVMHRLTIFLCAHKKHILKLSDKKSYEDITIILPTLNEGKNIKSLLSYLIDTYRNCAIIVSDDGSRDDTKKIAASFQNSNLLFLDRALENVHGLTASVLDAIGCLKTKYFIVMDADGQHPSQKIEEIANQLRLGCRLVVATRVEVENKWSLWRRMISHTGTFLGKVSLLIRNKNYFGCDILSGFFGCETRFWNESMATGHAACHFRLKGYKVLFDFLKCSPMNFSIENIYYKFETRKAAVSKINVRVYFEYLKSCLFP